MIKRMSTGMTESIVWEALGQRCIFCRSLGQVAGVTTSLGTRQQIWGYVVIRVGVQYSEHISHAYAPYEI